MPRPRLLPDLPSSHHETGDHPEDIDPILLELNRIRLREGISVAALARACGMKRQQVSKILTGGTPNVGILTVRRISEALGTDFSLTEVDKSQ